MKLFCVLNYNTKMKQDIFREIAHWWLLATFYKKSISWVLQSLPNCTIDNFRSSVATMCLNWTEMVLCYQNCSDLLWGKIIRKISNSRPSASNFIFFSRSLEQFVWTVQWKVRTIFGVQNAFWTCSWRFLRCNKLERLKFKLDKIIGI